MEKERHRQLVRDCLKQQKVLTSYAYGILRDWSLAQDAVQETLVAVSTSPENYRDKGSLSAWLKKVTYYKCVDIMRQRQREIDVDDEKILALLEGQFDTQLNLVHARQFEIKKDLLKQCFGLLNKNSLQILMSYYRDGYRCNEIASRLNRSSNAIWLNLSRTRKVLNKCLTQQMKGEGL